MRKLLATLLICVLCIPALSSCGSTKLSFGETTLDIKMYEDLKYDINDECFFVKEDFLLGKSEEGDVDAMYFLAVLYYENDREEDAYEWFLKASEKGQADATYYLGNFYSHPTGFEIVESSDEKAVEYWSKAVELGSAKAMCELGWQYRQGWGVIEKNEEKAIELFEKAASLGYHKAFSWLSLCYQCGNGVEKNIEKAFEYAKKAYDALKDEII